MHLYTMKIPVFLTFKPLHDSPQPRFMRYVLMLAWLDWAFAVYSTIMFAPSDRWAMGLPTLGTQALLTIGMMLGSNVARGSYIVWTVFWGILALSAATAPEPGGLGMLEEYGPYVESFFIIMCLVLPRTNQWYASVRTVHRDASPEAQSQRAYRNLRIAAGWAFVWPFSICAGLALGTPPLAVLSACVPGIGVAFAIVIRQCWKLYKLRRAHGRMAALSKMQGT